MTVQISVTIWTILCFCAFMLILSRLLFKPMLSFMDARQEKIDRARQKKAAALQSRAEEEQQLQEARLAAHQKAEQDAAARLEQARDDFSQKSMEKKNEYARLLEEEKAALAEESARIQAAMEPQLEELAAVYARKLIF